MKKAKAVTKDPENFAFDDDTSDSDDDQLQAFNSKVGDLKPLFGNQPKTAGKDLPDNGSESDSSDDDEKDDDGSKNPIVEEEQNVETSPKTVVVKMKRSEEDAQSPSKKQKTEELGPGEKERMKYREKLTKMS